MWRLITMILFASISPSLVVAAAPLYPTRTTMPTTAPVIVPLAARAAPPGTQQAATQPVSPPLPEEFRESYAQAVSLMKLNQYDKAAPLMDKIYEAAPVKARSRSFVLNHAIFDVTRRAYVMRALKDLEEYLTAHRPEDEVATNILGAALAAAVEHNPRWKQQGVWQAAFREWDRRNFNLEHSRPGMHRWGTKWLTEEQYAAVKSKIDDWNHEVEAQRERITRAKWKLDSVTQQLNDLDQTARDPNNRAYGDAYFARQEARRIRREELPDAQNYYTDMVAALDRLQQQNPRPEWPKRFDPVEPE